MVLVVKNPGTMPVKLKKSCILGQVVPVTEYSLSETKDESTRNPDATTACSLASATDACEDRETLLLQQLKLNIDHLSLEEQRQLKDLVCAYADVFVLNLGELGSTDVVKHTINAGDHPPPPPISSH